jgi:hypothetical protein
MEPDRPARWDRQASRRGLIPGAIRVERSVAWCEEEGRVVLLVPRFGHGRVGKILGGLFGRHPIRVRLDDTGSRVWRLLDSCPTVEAIGQALGEGLQDEAVKGRLDHFLRLLQRAGYVRLLESVTGHSQAPGT